MLSYIKMKLQVFISCLFRHTGFILSLAFVIGLSFPQGAYWARPAVTPILGLIMTLSVMSISPKIFLKFKRLLFPIFISLSLSYLLLGGTFIGLSSILLRDYELWTGFVLVAAVPPAVAVIPYTYHLGGNTRLSLVGTVSAFLAALVLTPMISILFLGTSYIAPVRLLVNLGELIVAPLIISQVLRKTGIAGKIEKYRGLAVNWGFFIIVYIIIGLNRETFTSEPLTLVLVSVVAFISTFLLTYFIDLVFKYFGFDKADRISFILLGTRKNYGLAAAIALEFFSPRTAMPTAVAMAFAILLFIWLTFSVKKMT
jgi:BASS family bile acid:Na+ symporter